MRGRRGVFSLFTSLPDHQEEKADDQLRRRRRRHSSGDRETWSHKVEYFFASLGYAVGLGNIWRFPYLCYRNGGGAFLIPYLLVLVGVGFPILFMEMAFGQFASLGTITIWRCAPLFKGIGYAIVVVLILVNTYYNVLISYALFYLFASITSELPWSRCDNKWNTDKCVLRHQGSLNNGLNVYNNSVNYLNTTNLLNSSLSAGYNTTTLMPIERSILKTPTEEYFEYHLLRLSSGIHELGSVQWPLIVCLCVSWFTCFMCLFKGIKSMGKAVIFTTILSYGILTVLMIRGVTLPGSVNGIIFYLKPDFSKLLDRNVWGEASAQAFASLTLGCGGWVTLSSYNKFSNRCNRDAILVGIGNALTSFYAGFVIFSVLGYMAHIKGVDVAEVTAQGPGLAFVAYPEGLALIPGAPFWSVCFFFMMFTVGLDSLFGQVETIVAGIIDEYPDFLRPRRKLFLLFLIVLMFLIGIPLTTQGGMYIVTLMDWFTLLLSFSILSLFEVVAIMYVYGFRKFASDIELMIGIKPNKFYMVTWLIISPLLLLLVIIFLVSLYVPPTYGSYRFPPYAHSLGWCIALIPCALIPITMFVMFILKCGGFKGFKSLFTSSEARSALADRLIRPTADWGPALPEIRRKYSYNVRVGDDDDVFSPSGAGDARELVNIENNDSVPRDRLVSFEDEIDEKAPPPYSDVKPENADEKGQGEGAAADIKV